MQISGMSSLSFSLGGVIFFKGRELVPGTRTYMAFLFLLREHADLALHYKPHKYYKNKFTLHMV